MRDIQVESRLYILKNQTGLEKSQKKQKPKKQNSYRALRDHFHCTCPGEGFFLSLGKYGVKNPCSRYNKCCLNGFVFFGLSGELQQAVRLCVRRSVVLPIAQEFSPDVLLVSAGFDAAEGNPAPLGGYKVSAKCKPRERNLLLWRVI